MITSPAEEYICLKVKDVLGMTTLDLKRLVYPVDATFKNLFDDTAEAFGMNVEDFDLTYQEKMDLVNFACKSECVKLFLGEKNVHFCLYGHYLNNFTMYKKQ